MSPSVLASHSELLRRCGSCRCRAPAADLLQVRGRNSSKYIKTTRPVFSPSSGETLTNQVFQPSRVRRRRSVFFFFFPSRSKRRGWRTLVLSDRKLQNEPVARAHGGNSFWEPEPKNHHRPHRVNAMQEIVPCSLSTKNEKKLLFFLSEYLKS